MNFRSILSKSSLRSSTSSGKSLTQSEEVSKLQSDIELLKQTVDSLKVSVESRDAAIGTLARDKEKLYIELKSTQRSNRNLLQQLVDERDFHSKEKEFLMDQIKRMSRQSDYILTSPPKMDFNEDQSKYDLNEGLKEKDEVIYSIGAKYLKIKSSKIIMRKKLEKLQMENKKRCEDIITLLSENRMTLDKLLARLIKSSTMPPRSKKYLKLLQTNANLHFENTQLKIYISSQKEPSFKKNCYPQMKIHERNRSIVGGRDLGCHSKLFEDFTHKRSLKIQGLIYRSFSDSCIVKSELS